MQEYSKIIDEENPKGAHMQTTFACVRGDSPPQPPFQRLLLAMAIYHLQVKTIKRSAGRSAVAAAAYRAGERIVDERTRETHNYRSKSDVMHTQIVLPPSVPKWAADRAKLWNQAEARENRKELCHCPRDRDRTYRSSWTRKNKNG